MKNRKFLQSLPNSTLIPVMVLVILIGNEDHTIIDCSTEHQTQGTHTNQTNYTPQQNRHINAYMEMSGIASTMPSSPSPSFPAVMMNERVKRFKPTQVLKHQLVLQSRSNIVSEDSRLTGVKLRTTTEFNNEVASSKLTKTYKLAPPSIDRDETPGNVSVQLGGTAFIPCKVNNLGDKSVSWIRKRDSHILSVDREVFIGDLRFSSLYDSANQVWTLQIKRVRKEDEAVYECQLSTQPKKMRSIMLNVIVPSVRISGNREIHVQTGSSVQLKCLTTHSLTIPAYIMWYHQSLPRTNPAPMAFHHTPNEFGKLPTTKQKIRSVASHTSPITTGRKSSRLISSSSSLSSFKHNRVLQGHPSLNKSPAVLTNPPFHAMSLTVSNSNKTLVITSERHRMRHSQLSETSSLSTLTISDVVKGDEGFYECHPAGIQYPAFVRLHVVIQGELSEPSIQGNGGTTSQIIIHHTVLWIVTLVAAPLFASMLIR